MQISQLFIYPIKSLGGIEVKSAELQPRGFKYDRRWMLVDESNIFLTQREHISMAMLQTEITASGLRVSLKQDPSLNVEIPFETQIKTDTTVKVWDDLCEAIVQPQNINDWFSDILKMKCKLVYMPDTVRRTVDPDYAVSSNDITGFSDAYPILLIGQGSLDHLNSKLAQPLPINRFRPNIVFIGGRPYQEDEMEYFRINGIKFYGVKLCTRCVMTTIDQESFQKGKEPLRTLATYRSKNNKIYFGQNIIHEGSGLIHVGDNIEVIKQKQAAFSHE